MRNLIAALMLVIVTSGCILPDRTPVDTEPVHEVQREITVLFKEITIDSCQYLIIYNDNNIGQSVVHKGNCNNPIHKTK